MADDPKHLVRTAALPPEEGVRVRHPLNPNSEVLLHRLGDRAGMQRVHLSLARVPPGRESFVPHAHAVQEEFLFILEGEGIAQIGDRRGRVGPGDYMGFPTDGTAHHLTNTGSSDLVYLMGGERTAVEVSHFPTLGRTAVMRDGEVVFFPDEAAQTFTMRDWIAD